MVKKMNIDDNGQNSTEPPSVNRQTGTWAVVFKSGAVVEVEGATLQVNKSPSGTNVSLSKKSGNVIANPKTGWGIDKTQISGFVRIK